MIRTFSGAFRTPSVRERKQQKTRLFYRKESVIRTLGRSPHSMGKGPPCPNVRNVRIVRNVRAGRSEEQTSELQSLMRISSDVFCLQKNKPPNYQQYTHYTNTKETRP